MILIVIFTILSLAVGVAWVGGYLDKYQSKAQEKALDAMGENKASYGVKGMLVPDSNSNSNSSIHRETWLITLLLPRHCQRPEDWQR